MKISNLIILLFCCLTAIPSRAVAFSYAPAPVDNPLKGVVPYVSQHPHGRFPHSMEFTYIPMRDLMNRTRDADGSPHYIYDWTLIEKRIKTATARGCQLIFRVYLEYPEHPIAVPQFLIDDGLKITEWTHPKENKTNCTPDYEDPRLHQAIKVFIAAMGKKYDGDSRVAFITAGILGKWGEWHNWPRGELFASPQVQQEVMDAYATAFKTTKILLRYPAGIKDFSHASNAGAPFGYHDDSFAWATLDTGESANSWYYMALLKKAGPQALNKWKTFPIGGEIRPELWKAAFTDQPHSKQQDFDQCVRQTHATWLMDTGLSSPRYPLPESRYERAIQSVQRMGYELHISNADCQRKNDQLDVSITIENRGVAPFYYDWSVELALLNRQGDPVHIWKMPWKLSTVLPNEPAVWKSGLLTLPENSEKDLRVAIGIPNPMTEGKPLRLANIYHPVTSAWLLLE